MYALLFISSPAIARFYRIPLLCDVLRVQGLILFIYALNTMLKVTSELRLTMCLGGSMISSLIDLFIIYPKSLIPIHTYHFGVDLRGSHISQIRGLYAE